MVKKQVSKFATAWNLLALGGWEVGEVKSTIWPSKFLLKFGFWLSLTIRTKKLLCLFTVENWLLRIPG